MSQNGIREALQELFGDELFGEITDWANLSNTKVEDWIRECVAFEMRKRKLLLACPDLDCVTPGSWWIARMHTTEPNFAYHLGSKMDTQKVIVRVSVDWLPAPEMSRFTFLLMTSENRDVLMSTTVIARRDDVIDIIQMLCQRLHPNIKIR